MPVKPHRLFTQGLLTLTFAMLAGAAVAQPAAEQANSIPAAQVDYKSAISDYQPYTDQNIQSWSEANDRVGRIGGWRTYAKEISTGESSKDSSDATDPHAGHGKGGKQ